ncbi:TIGR03089 family protein [Pseudactinotalea sp. Z1748]|uniref:TIGR03089 family protein n=1 Tax=Pseudactinotalea sp. Z1748 TaxID=3413027 RepID=UPI003C7E53DE
MADVSDLIASWQGPEGAHPRLTWYGPGAERVELSGRVLANWVIKVANLVTEEADAEPSTVVAIDLPVHWRALVWSLGTWLTGAQAHLRPGRPDDDLIVTDRPQDAPSGPLLIAVALPALAMAFDADLPAGAIDGAADLMTYPDQLLMPTDAADLSALAGPAWSGPERVLVPVADLAADRMVARVLAMLLGGASVVLVADADADAAHLARVEGAEPAHERGTRDQSPQDQGR